MQAVADDQPDRYAAASGDHFVIHLDDDAARARRAAGPDPARLLHARVHGSGRLRGGRAAAIPRRIAARFSAPVFPGDDLTTRVWELGDGAYGFEASCGPDRVVIKDGLVEVR